MILRKYFSSILTYFFPDVITPPTDGGACRNYGGMIIDVPISTAAFQALRPELLTKGKGHCVQRDNGGHSLCVSTEYNGVLQGSPDCGNRPGTGTGTGATGTGTGTGTGTDGGAVGTGAGAGATGTDDVNPPPPPPTTDTGATGGDAGTGGTGTGTGGDAPTGSGDSTGTEAGSGKPNWQCCITDTLNNPDVNGIRQAIDDQGLIVNGGDG